MRILLLTLSMFMPLPLWAASPVLVSHELVEHHPSSMGTTVTYQLRVTNRSAEHLHNLRLSLVDIDLALFEEAAELEFHDLGSNGSKARLLTLETHLTAAEVEHSRVLTFHLYWQGSDGKNAADMVRSLVQRP